MALPAHSWSINIMWAYISGNRSFPSQFTPFGRYHARSARYFPLFFSCQPYKPHYVKCPPLFSFCSLFYIIGACLFLALAGNAKALHTCLSCPVFALRYAGTLFISSSALSRRRWIGMPAACFYYAFGGLITGASPQSPMPRVRASPVPGLFKKFFYFSLLAKRTAKLPFIHFIVLTTLTRLLSGL